MAQRLAFEQKQLGLQRREMELRRQEIELQARAEQDEARACAERSRADGKAAEAEACERRAELAAKRMVLDQHRVELDIERLELQAKQQAEELALRAQLDGASARGEAEEQAVRQLERYRAKTDQERLERNRALERDAAAAEQRVRALEVQRRAGPDLLEHRQPRVVGPGQHPDRDVFHAAEPSTRQPVGRQVAEPAPGGATGAWP